MADKQVMNTANGNDKNASRAQKKAEKLRKKEEKKAKRAQKKAAKGNADIEESEKEGSKLAVVLVTIIIILVWMAILAFLVKSDVGGFGSTVLYPVLKDVPYVNKILPDTGKEETEQNQQSPYATLDEAVARIKELEKELDDAAKTDDGSDSKIQELETEVKRLKVFEENQTKFQEQKEKFDKEVVFADNAPDIDQYKQYYESIDPANAEELYKEVVSQQQADKEVSDYAKTYSSMKPKEAAAILDTMTDDLELVSRILENMDTDSRANILGAMSTDVAAKVTKLMEP